MDHGWLSQRRREATAVYDQMTLYIIQTLLRGFSESRVSPPHRPREEGLLYLRHFKIQSCCLGSALCELSFGERYTASRLRSRVRSP
jgi:hypothetical protein